MHTPVARRLAAWKLPLASGRIGERVSSLAIYIHGAARGKGAVQNLRITAAKPTSISLRQLDANNSDLSSS
jgi:hypothetical protein